MISINEVKEVIKNGQIIANYPTDKPFPSVLLFTCIEERPMHVVLAKNNEGNCFVITAYEPDKNLWNEGFLTKK